MNKKIIKSLFLMFSAIFLATSSSGAYFFDYKTSEENYFSAGIWDVDLEQIVINEVYYSVGERTYPQGVGVKTEEEGLNEWIELYNSGNQAINLKNYKIGNNSFEFTINPNVWINPGEFVLLSHDHSTWHFWDNPNVEKINLGGKVLGGWFENDQDRVYLKNPAGEIVDEILYTDDENEVSGNVCLGVPSGYSLEREPAGYKTPTGCDFVTRENPTPGN